MLMCVVCESVSSLSYFLCISFDEQSQHCQYEEREEETGVHRRKGKKRKSSYFLCFVYKYMYVICLKE